MQNVVDQFYSYGDMPPWGKGPVQGKIHANGAHYIEQEFPKTDRFTTCTVERIQMSGSSSSSSSNNNNSNSDSKSSASATATTVQRIGASLSGDNNKNNAVYLGIAGTAFVVVVVVWVRYVYKLSLQKRRKSF